MTPRAAVSLLPLINSTAEEYVKANTGWPKRTEPCDKSS